MCPLEQFQGNPAGIYSTKKLGPIRIRLLLLNPDQFGQGVEPLEVKGYTHEILFAFHCLQSA